MLFATADIAAQATRALLAEFAAMGKGRCLLLIDPTLRPIDTGDEAWHAYAGLPHTRVAITHAMVDPGAWPILTPLRLAVDTQHALLLHSVEEACKELEPAALRAGHGRRIGGWIVSDAPIEDVAWHLGQAMLQRRPSNEMVWLRLQDPAVLWPLSGWLEPAQQSALLGPMHSFNLLNPSGQLLSLHAEVPAGASGVALTAGQWAAIDCIEPLNTALRHWDGLQRPEQLGQARSMAFAAIRRAKALGFGDSSDLALYGRCALEVHARFDFHPLVSSRLRIRRPDDFFGSLIEDLTRRDWDRIRQESPEAPAT